MLVKYLSEGAVLEVGTCRPRGEQLGDVLVLHKPVLAVLHGGSVAGIGWCEQAKQPVAKGLDRLSCSRDRNLERNSYPAFAGPG